MIKLELVDSTHPMCFEKSPDKLSSGAKTFWKSRLLYKCDFAVIAKDNNKIVGFLRFDIGGLTLYGHGTYVIKTYRNLGLAKKMWNKAIRSSKAKYVNIVATSDGALNLANYLKNKHVKKKFEICDERNCY